MHSNHPSAKRLEKVADTFTRLAEAYVRHSMQQQNGSSKAKTPNEVDTFAADIAVASVSPAIPDLIFHDAPDIANSDDALHIPDREEISSWMSTLSSEDHLNSMNFDHLDSDPMALLNFFSTNPYLDMPASAAQVEPCTERFVMQAQTSANAMADNRPTTADQLFRELEQRAMNCAVDGTFDWFSWDAYDQNDAF